MKVKIQNIKIVNPPKPKGKGPKPFLPPPPRPDNVENFDDDEDFDQDSSDNEDFDQDSSDNEGKSKGSDKKENKGDDKGKDKGENESDNEKKEGEGMGKIKKITNLKPKKRSNPKKNPKPIKAPNQDDIYEPNVDKGESEQEHEKKMQDKITRAYDQTMRENRGSTERGTASGSGVGGLFKKDILKTKTDWKALLRGFIGGLPKIEQNWNRPASRYWTGIGQYMPSEKLVKDTLDLVVAIDTSGSISSNQIHIFLNEVATIITAAKRVKLKVLFWMDKVYQDVDVDSKTMGLEAIKQKLQSIPIRNDGGTTLSSVKKYLSSKGIKKVEGLIYFTDGYTESNPQIPRVEKNRVLFMITPGGSTVNVSKTGIGRVVEVDIK